MSDQVSAGGEYTTEEMMTVAASRELRDGAVCFVGIGLPSEAANLARATHAPNCVLVYESGTIGAKPEVLPLSIGDGVLAERADSVVSVPEIFNYWLQAGRIDVGFLGGAQVDRYANINTTVIGPYDSPKVRLPGAGGAPEIAASAKEVIMVLRQPTVPVLVRGPAVQLRQRSEPRGLAADDRQRQRQSEGPGAHDRLRVAADRDPHRQRLLHRPREHRLVDQGRAVPPRPGHPVGVPQLQEQVQLLGEQLVVVVERVAEQRERLDERPAPGHDLRAAVREQVDGRVLLEDP